jgi:hypothetical protein
MSMSVLISNRHATLHHRFIGVGSCHNVHDFTMVKLVRRVPKPKKYWPRVFKRIVSETSESVMVHGTQQSPQGFDYPLSRATLDTLHTTNAKT